MWLYFTDAALSIVAHLDRPGDLLVRSRTAGDIEAVFPDAVVDHTPTWDYAYRTILPREAVAAAVAELVLATPYSNFKNSVKDAGRHGRYYDVYNATLRGSYTPATPTWSAADDQVSLFDDDWRDYEPAPLPMYTFERPAPLQPLQPDDSNQEMIPF